MKRLPLITASPAVLIAIKMSFFVKFEHLYDLSIPKLNYENYNHAISGDAMEALTLISIQDAILGSSFPRWKRTSKCAPGKRKLGFPRQCEILTDGQGHYDVNINSERLSLWR